MFESVGTYGFHCLLAAREKVVWAKPEPQNPDRPNSEEEEFALERTTSLSTIISVHVMHLEYWSRFSDPSLRSNTPHALIKSDRSAKPKYMCLLKRHQDLGGNLDAFLWFPQDHE